VCCVKGLWKAVRTKLQNFLSCANHYKHRKKATKIPTFIHLFKFCVAEMRLCVLQAAVGSLQSADCDTEWLIGINVVTGGVLCRKGIVSY
jgi:hypothetical protein